MNDHSYDPSHEEIESWKLDKEQAEDKAWRAARRKASAKVEQAIDQSIGENRTVTLSPDSGLIAAPSSETGEQTVFPNEHWLLFDGLTCQAEDSIVLKGVVEFWGITDEGEKWRIDLPKM